MKLKEGLKISTIGGFQHYLKSVNDCPFSTPCPVDELESKADGYRICVECCRKYLVSRSKRLWKERR